MQAMVEIKGLSPILMHSCSGLDPTHPLRKEAATITAKRGPKKTEADLERLDWIDFQLSAYHNGKHLFIPGENLHGLIRDGARASRKGKEIQAAVQVIEQEIPIIYDGPKELRALYDKKFVDRRRVVIQRSAVLRTRCRLNKWSLTFSLFIEQSVINPESVKEALEYAGARIGLGDFRPRFGRFEVVAWEAVK